VLEEVFDDHWLERVAILGDARFAGRLTSDLTAAATHAYYVLGYVCDTDGVSVRAEEGSSSWLGRVTDLNRIVAEHRVDVLVLAPGRHSATEIARTIACQQADVRIVSAASFYEVQGQVPIGMIDASWLELGHHQVSQAFDAAKRGVDLAVCFLLTAVVVPAMAVIALTIALCDGRPVLYRQLRVGERGQEFWLLKFRSMRVDAESDGLPVWTVGDDPRATPLGAFLRRSHLDELPQLLNVLKGEMSIVGPRPERPAFVAQLAERYPFYRPRLIVKPGVTGWAQLRCGYAGSDAGSGRKLCADLYYIKHRSLLLDFMIMVETIRTLFLDREYAHELDAAGVVNFSDLGR
jgi:exopolysaccharide biosynthesis polyprenyl glycosylphosphotransferase